MMEAGTAVAELLPFTDVKMCYILILQNTFFMTLTVYVHVLLLLWADMKVMLEVRSGVRSGAPQHVGL